MAGVVGEKPKLKIPTGFKKMLVECIDPTQSCDYAKLGGSTFPIQVLPIGLEKKILRLADTASSLDSDAAYDFSLSMSAGEICRFYNSTISLDWPGDNASKDELENLCVKHLEKMRFNDEVELVVYHIENMIEWKPIEESRKEESERYTPSRILLPALTYLNLIEGYTPDYIFRNMTRGLLAIVKLNNMISSDRMTRVDIQKEKSNKINSKMSSASTLDEYMKGLSDQGFSVSDLLK